MTGVLRRLRRLLRPGPGSSQPFRSLDRNVTAAGNTVRVFYILSIFASVRLMYAIAAAIDGGGTWAFLWPLAWVPPDRAADILPWFGIGAVVSAIAAIIDWRIRLFRIAFAVCFLLAASVPGSVGAINHGFHAWIFVAFILATLPRRVETRADRLSMLTTIVTCQSLLMLFYTMAGFWKIQAGLVAIWNGSDGIFAAEALGWTLADRILQTGTKPFLAKVVIDHAWLAWPGLKIVMYAQLFALVAAFRPRLHVLWGVLLIAFHLGTWVTMEIIFMENMALIALLLIASPFRPEKTTLRDVVSDLPLIGLPLRLRRRRRDAPIPAPAE